MIQVDSEKCIIGLHCPVKMASVSYSDGTRLEGRQRCKVCNARVNTYCEQCDVALCFGDYQYPDDSCLSSITRALRSDS